MNKSQAQTSIKKLNTESAKLNPSAVVVFYEIDITDLALDMSIVTDGEVSSLPNDNIIRLHNNFKLFSKSLNWQGNEYIVAPLEEEGFEVNSSGTIPEPKIRVSIEGNSGMEPILAKLKDKINKINGLIGAKLTRKSTFVKYLDADNFIEDEPPAGFDPDPNVHFPDSIFYFEKKSHESKNIIEFELSSLIDLNNLKLPNRIVSSTQCPFAYRGAGCMYEYKSRRVVNEHGTIAEADLPNSAPPVANDRDEKILDILKNQTGHTSYTSLKDRGEWQSGLTYNLGDTVFIQKRNIKYYFVCKVSNTNQAPPNGTYWIFDMCGKKVSSCNMRWGNKGSGFLRYGGFASVNRAG